jgi:hypothetical protein
MANLFDIINVQRRPNTYIVRQERIKREGSPYYPWTPGVIAPTATEVIHVPTQFPDSRKYQPLDWIEVCNNDAANDLTLTINGNESWPVPAKTIRTIDNLALWHVQLTNNGGVNTTAGSIVVTLQKQPLTIDKWARRQ